LADIGLQAPLPERVPFEAPPPGSKPVSEIAAGGGLRLLRYRPLFSGPSVERVGELQFQRPPREIELSAADAERHGIQTGDEVAVRSNGSSVSLRARVNRRLLEGVVRAAEEHVAVLHASVEVAKGRP
jgi:anaerobic selenocysteine-containing dehydrogenase